MEIFEYRKMQVQLIEKAIKHCYLRVKPDGIIMLTHNKLIKKPAALELIDKNWGLIESKLSKLSKPNDLSIGSDIYFLGECYKLNITLNKQVQVMKINNYLHISTPKDEFEIKSKILNAWYLQQSKPILTKQYEKYLDNISYWKIKTPLLRFRTMKRRWGSYNKTTNTITLNTHLIKVSPQIIDYIIAHELCHTLHFNHSSAFYNELSKLHPTWREQKRELDLLSSKI